MRKSLFVCGLMAVLVLAFAACNNKPAAPAKEADKPAAPAAAADDPAAKAAVVNGTTLTMKDLKAELDRVLQQAMAVGQSVQGPDLDALRHKTLDNMIDRELLAAEAAKQGIKVSQADVDKQFAELKAKFPNPEEFNKVLQKMGVTEAEGKAQLMRDMGIQLYLKGIIDKMPAPTDAEMKAFFEQNKDRFGEPEQVRASHILVKVDGNADQATKDAAKKKITELLGKLKKGADFAKLASENSDCPSKAQGGDLGFFGHGQMVKEFEDVAFKLDKGKLSDVVQTQFGFHIIKVTDKKAGKPATFDTAKSKIADEMKEGKVRETVMAAVKKLRDQAKIEVFIKDAAPSPAAATPPAPGATPPAPPAGATPPAPPAPAPAK